MNERDKTAENRPTEDEASSLRKWENTYDILDIFKDIITFIAVTAFAFGWMMLMLLIISFLTLSYLHFNIKVMFFVSAAAGAAAGIAHIVKAVKKYSGMTRKRH